MRQKIDVNAIYAKALRLLPEKIDGQPPLPVPEQCPVTLDELLSEDWPAIIGSRAHAGTAFGADHLLL
jgi:hypothetical protein